MNEDCPTIVIIKRSGEDGPRFPLRRKECLFGRDATCDLRVQRPGVALEHAKVCHSEENDEFYLENLADSETKINGQIVNERIGLKNMDIFSIAERSFRFECGGQHETNENVKPKSPRSKAFQSPEKLPCPSENSKIGVGQGEVRASPLQAANRSLIKDSPRTPRRRHSSLRESLGKLRRASVPFKEADENKPDKHYETKENHEALIVEHVVAAVTSNPFTAVTTPRSTKKSTKRVSFGPMLSPEQFDKDLPVSTPVRKGGTPRRLSAPLSRSCISPARRRYSLAVPALVSRIEEEKEESEDEKEQLSESKVDTPGENSVTEESRKLATPVRKDIERGKKLRRRRKKMATPLKSAIKQGFRLKATKKKLQTPLRNEIEAGVKLRSTRKKLATPLRQAIEEKPSLRSTKKKMATPVREAIEARPALRQTKNVMAKELQNEIRKGTTLRKTKKVMVEELQREIQTGIQLRETMRRMKSELQDEIIKGKKMRQTKRMMSTPLRAEIVKGVELRATRRRMPTMLQDEIKSGKMELRKTKKSLKTPMKKEIEAGVSLRKTKRRMPTMLQDEIKSGMVELTKTKKSLKTPLKKEIQSGVALRKTKRRMPTILQDEIKSGMIELTKTKKSLKTPLKKEIQSGVALRKTKRRMPTMLQDEIKSGMVELTKTKKSLKTPLKKEIRSGVALRKTKRRMPTMLQDEIKSGMVELTKTKKSLKNPLKKEIQSGVALRKTKRRMPTMLQDEIKSGMVELTKTKKSLKTPLKKEIRSGVALRKTKKRMPTMLQDEIKSGMVELTKTKKSLKTPLKKEIETGVALRKTKRRMPTMLQDEIKSGQLELLKTKKSLKTPLRKEIESGFRLRRTKMKPGTDVTLGYSSKTPKRCHSDMNDGDVEYCQSASKSLKTPSRTPRQAGFFPSSRTRGRSSSRRKSIKPPSYAEILKRPKLTGKRRLTSRQTSVFEFQAQEQKVTNKSQGASTEAAVAKTDQKRRNKTPTRRKSEAKSKVTETKMNNEWQVVVNKRKIKRIKRQRAGKAEQQADFSGLSVLFKTPKPTRSKVEKPKTPKNENAVSKVEHHVCCCEEPADDSILYGVARLMKTPKVRNDGEENYEGVAELFEVLEMEPAVEAATTPSLRKVDENMRVVSALEITRTPSLRNKEGVDEVATALPPSTTPSLRRGSVNVIIEAAQQAENVTMMSPVKELRTSLTLAAPEFTIESAEVHEAMGEVHEVDIIVGSLPQHSESSSTGSTTRSKRKAVDDALSVAKRSRRVTTRESDSNKTPMGAGLCTSEENKNTRLEKSKKTQLEKKAQETSTQVQVEDGEPKKTTTKRASRIRARLQSKVETEAVGILSSSLVGSGRQEASEQKVKSRKEKNAPVPQPTKDEVPPLVVEKPRTRRGGRGVGVSSVPTEVTKESHRATRCSKPVHADTKPKESTAPLNSETKQQSARPSKKSIRADSKSGNVPGIPETPPPFCFVKTKLDPIVEVPTPASSTLESSLKPERAVSRVRSRGGVALEKIEESYAQTSKTRRATRSKREKTSGMLETVEESQPSRKRRKEVLDEGSNVKSGSTRSAKENDEAEKMPKKRQLTEGDPESSKQPQTERKEAMMETKGRATRSQVKIRDVENKEVVGILRSKPKTRGQKQQVVQLIQEYETKVHSRVENSAPDIQAAKSHVSQLDVEKPQTRRSERGIIAQSQQSEVDHASTKRSSRSSPRLLADNKPEKPKALNKENRDTGSKSTRRTTRVLRETTIVTEEVVEETRPSAKRRKTAPTDDSKEKEVAMVVMTTRARRARQQNSAASTEKCSTGKMCAKNSRSVNVTAAGEEERGMHIRNNDKEMAEEVVQEQTENSPSSRQSRKRKVTVVVAESKRASGLSNVGQLSTRTRRATARVIKEDVEKELAAAAGKINVESTKRPRRGATSKTDGKGKTNEDHVGSESALETKRTPETKSPDKTRSAATRSAEKIAGEKPKEAQKKQSSKKEGKTATPVGRLTRSRSNAK